MCWCGGIVLKLRINKNVCVGVEIITKLHFFVSMKEKMRRGRLCVCVLHKLGKKGAKRSGAKII